jgi:hypothetical protein
VQIFSRCVGVIAGFTKKAKATIYKYCDYTQKEMASYHYKRAKTYLSGITVTSVARITSINVNLY